MGGGVSHASMMIDDDQSCRTTCFLLKISRVPDFPTPRWNSTAEPLLNTPIFNQNGVGD